MYMYATAHSSVGIGGVEPLVFLPPPVQERGEQLLLAVGPSSLAQLVQESTQILGHTQEAARTSVQKYTHYQHPHLLLHTDQCLDYHMNR